MKTTVSLVAVILTISLQGCASSSLLKTSTNMLTAPVDAVTSVWRDKPVAKILCLWEAAEGQGLDEKPSRGFAGQIMFFTYGDPSPIKVNGKIRIFEYADFDADEVDPEPIHRFLFDSGAWGAHHTVSTVGHTYNCFLPYVVKTSGPATCALRVEIETEDGRIVSSPYTEVKLTSRTSPKAATGITRNVVENSSTKPVSQSMSKEQLPKRKLESMTIQLPKGSQ